MQGAYSLIFMNHTEVIAVRDPHGFRPLCLGQLESGYVVTSETCALDLIEAGVIHDGMIPKVETAIDALGLGINQVRILDLEGLVEGGGTIFRSPSPQPVGRRSFSRQGLH